MPEITPHITEYQRHRLKFPCCSQTTCAALPDGVPSGQSGPRLMAFTALLMASFRQSKRRTSLFLGDLLGQPCSPALTVKIQNEVSNALEPPYQELRDALPSEDRVFMDESPTKQAGQRAWLWAVVTPLYAVYSIFMSRAGTAVDTLLGSEFGGFVNCDRAKMEWRVEHLQWCWSHLKRDFQALVDSPDTQAKRLGHDLMRHVTALFKHWRAYHKGRISRRAFRCRMAPVRAKIDALLLRGACSGNKWFTGMCSELYSHRTRPWAFVDHEGIEPTNNTAERALRHAVIWRKSSFGTQSMHGSLFVERMLTVIETCRIQKRSVFDYVTKAVEARVAKQPAPSLLPGV